jgi:multicomponent Na+:H+ antiporter subunit D
MSAGSVLYMTGRRKCTDLGGLFHSMPVSTICGIIGALAISAFPLTSGFISKSMVSQAASDGRMLTVWLLLTAASAGVFLHAGIKFPWFVFFQKDSGLRPADPPASMRWAMIFFASLCIAIGIWPEPLYDLLPYPVTFEPYTGAHVVTQLQLLLFSGLAFFAMLPYLRRTLTITLDADWVWRRLLPAATAQGDRLVSATCSICERGAGLATALVADRLLRHRAPDGSFARTSSIRAMALWVLVLLLGYLVLYYL